MRETGGRNTAGGRREMILLIKLPRVIARHATRAWAKTVNAINGMWVCTMCVCLCVQHMCVFLSVSHSRPLSLSLSLPHTTQTLTLLDFQYQIFNKKQCRIRINNKLYASSLFQYWPFTATFFSYYYFNPTQQICQAICLTLRLPFLC